MQEPAVAGIMRPILLIPEGIEGWLSTEQLRAVLAHERCHVKRRDNLMAALHMVVEALFWFHPLVWWLESRLIAERERACDEAVLAEGNSAQSYAEGIVRVCQNCLESPLRCAAGVAGGNLAKRIDSILSSPRCVRLSALQAILLSGIATAIAEPVLSGHLNANSTHDGTAGGDPRWQAAASLPHTVWVRLKDSGWPNDKEMFQRNNQLTRPGAADAWGRGMQDKLRRFFAARAEAAGTQIAVACRENQCQVQLIRSLPGKPGEEDPSEVIIDDLRLQPWYQKELVPATGQFGANDGKSYALQYFDRKSSASRTSVTAIPPELAFACVGSAGTSDGPDIYQLMCNQMKAYPAGVAPARLVCVRA